MYQIILGSGSPRRKQILKMLGIDFEVIPADIDETIVKDETPTEYVYRLAKEKAAKVAADLPKQSLKNSLIIGGDVTVEVGGQALAKASDIHEARSMLEKLSGTTNLIRNAYAIYVGGEHYFSGVTTTAVVFREIGEQELAPYFEANDWQDKAGAYAIQGAAAKFVSDIKGSYFDVLGLPIYHIAESLFCLGFDIKPSTVETIRQSDIQLKLKTINAGS